MRTVRARVTVCSGIPNATYCIATHCLGTARDEQLACLLAIAVQPQCPFRRTDHGRMTQCRQGMLVVVAYQA